MDLEGRRGAVHRDEVQPRCTLVEHPPAELGRDLHAHLAHRRRVVLDGLEPPDELRRQRRAHELGHPLDLAHVGHRHEPGRHREVTARGHPVAQPQVGVGVEDHLGDREGRPGVGLADQHLDVVVEVGAVGVDVGEGRDADREVPEPPDQPDEVLGVVEPLGVGGPLAPDVPRRVAPQREDVAHPRRGVVADDLAQLAHRGADAGEVGERGERGLVGDPRRDPDGAVLGGPPRPVGDRDEGRPDPFEPAHGVPERGLGGVVLRREELEAHRGPGLPEACRDGRHEVLGAPTSAVVAHGGEGTRAATP